MDELSAAREEAKTAAVEQAVADGLITQAQADEILSGDSTSLPHVPLEQLVEQERS